MLQLRLKHIFIITLLFSFFPTIKAFIRPCVIPGEPRCKYNTSPSDENFTFIFGLIIFMFIIIIIGAIIYITEKIEKNN